MAGRCGCGSGSCSCQFASSDSITVSGTGSAGSPFTARVARCKLLLAWSGAAQALTDLESQRIPTEPVEVLSAAITATTHGGGAIDTEITLAVNGLATAHTWTLDAGSATESALVGLVIPTPSQISVLLNGTRGAHVSGLVALTCRYL